MCDARQSACGFWGACGAGADPGATAAARGGAGRERDLRARPQPGGRGEAADVAVEPHELRRRRGVEGRDLPHGLAPEWCQVVLSTAIILLSKVY
jgi:hypothetical protein